MATRSGRHPHSLRIRKKERRIAYFSMEVGVHSDIPTYSGGLGILAGDTIRSAADLNVPMVGVTLLYRKGYFFQKIDAEGQQHEYPFEWNPKKVLRLSSRRTSVQIEGREVHIQAWQYVVRGSAGYLIPVIFLDTDLPENDEYGRSLSYFLYGGDRRYRLSQELVLGVGGVRMLRELGYRQLNRYHMNEGHASLLTLELLRVRGRPEGEWDMDGVRRMCVFTTHTPVPAGHDKFSYDLVREVLSDLVPLELLQQCAGNEELNMTRLAMNLSHYVNGVAKQHGKVSQEMFPGYHIDSITNGVHSPTWVSTHFRKLFDKYMWGWVHDPFNFRYALSIPREEVWMAHDEAKQELIRYVNEHTGSGLDPEVFTIGFARRATAYKRADLVFHDTERLIRIAEEAGKVQFIFSGKAHPQDHDGKALIKKIIQTAHALSEKIKIVYLEHYNMDLAKMLISGVDLWLNTPRKPKEASGTSGMKAAHNGIPSLSILDGWWIEGSIENLTGWSIGTLHDPENDDERDAAALYEKLEKVIVPSYYRDRDRWIDIMRHCIAINASFFNTHRMIQQYVLNAYLH
ncbi:MAG: alpha-glucan family phosphorylase [Candidatus Omnitrophica bacterium]|nr:alpha-glucan family phosphorylase [Candidatus Omnitrophota bacterium]